MSAERLVIDPESISSEDGSRGFEIYVPGYDHDAAVTDEAGTQVYLEIIQGKLKVYVWNGEEDPAVTVEIDRKEAS